MAGTLVLDTLQNGAGTASTSADNVINGSAKAWVNFNGTGTVAINSSYNVSSITDNGTGDYTINFTNALSNANYSITQQITYVVGTTTYAMAEPHIVSISSSSFRVRTPNTSGTLFDCDYCSFSVFR